MRYRYEILTGSGVVRAASPASPLRAAVGAPANTFSPVFLYLFIAQGQPTYPLLFWCCLFIMFLSIYYPCVGIIALMEFPAKDKLRAGPSRAPQLRKKSWSVNILIPPECGPRWLSVVHRLHQQSRRRANSVLAIFLFSARVSC